MFDRSGRVYTPGTGHPHRTEPDGRRRDPDIGRAVSSARPPACLRSDNSPELVAATVQKWLKAKHVDTHYIDPGSPWQNAYNESFNSIFRTTCLDRWLFCSMTEARVVIKHWLDEYKCAS